MRTKFFIAALCLLAFGYWWLRKPQPEPLVAPPYKPISLDRSRCPGETVQLKMQDVYMRGIIEIHSPIRVTLNWYACHPVAKGDLVYYRFAEKMEPVVKRVLAVGGDRIRVTPDKNNRGWNLSVNGTLVKAHGTPYFFAAIAPPPIKLYEIAHHGLLDQGDVVVLSSFPPGDSDSGTFGVVRVEDLIGKVEHATN